jgi:PTS system nitrogen regulatory IIA component
MKLVDVVHEACIETGCSFAEKDDALKAVAAAAKRIEGLENASEAAILDALREREALGSTGFGNGIAIPHCRVPGATRFVVGLFTVPGGVDFDALDGEPVSLIVFIVGPDEASDRHVRLLSAISRTLMIPGATKELIASKSPETARESFLRFTVDDLDTRNRTARCLVHLFVQDDERLSKLVSAFASIGTSSFVVIEAENASAYLTKHPLFAGFISDSRKSFSKLIIAIADQKLKNEIVRQVEQIVGSLDDATGTLLTVQDITFAAGSLEA